jgi:hypothetical protein
MMPVGGSRHYTGGGLGAETGWTCPSCGAENSGPISQGCQLCGAGRPGRRADPPPKPPDAPGIDDPAGAWLQAHPHASLREAFLAGYAAGHAAAQPSFSPEGKRYRTIAAALSLFRDQVLSANPEEIRSGEWCSVAEVNDLIAQLSEPAHV